MTTTPSRWPIGSCAPEQDAADARRLQVPARFYDEGWERPIVSRYVDPLDALWLATAHRLDLIIRRDPAIFAMTDGTGLLALSTRDELDDDDNLAQMLLHEICHWITNGAASYELRDWGFPLWDEIDVREYACVRLQCWLAGRYGMREMFGPTSGFRLYYDQLPDDPLEPCDDSEWEAVAVRIARQAVQRAQGEPWWGPLTDALSRTRAMRDAIAPLCADYRPEREADRLLLWWAQRHHTDR